MSEANNVTMDHAKKPRTLYEKLFDDHVVAERDDGTVLLYIGRVSRLPQRCMLIHPRPSPHP